MPLGYFNSILESPTSAQTRMFSATNEEFQGNLFEDVLANSPMSAVGTGTQLAYATDNFTGENSRTLDPQEANQKYGLKGELKFSSPITESAAKIMYDRKYYELQRREVLGQGTSSQNLVGFGTGMAATLIDPINIALSIAIPPIAESKLASLAGNTLSRQVAAKTIGGAIDAGLAVGVGQGLTAGALNEAQADYTMNTALRDVGMGMVLGGAIHGGIGAYKASKGLPVTDLMSKTKPETQLHAQVAAANDLLNGRSVVAPEQLIPFDENLTRAKAENSDAARAANTNAEPRDPLKPSGPKDAPPYFDPEFKFRENTDTLITFDPTKEGQQIPQGYEEVTLRASELHLEHFSEKGPSAATEKMPREEKIYAPTGAVKPQTLRRILRNNPGLSGSQVDFSAFKEIWKYLTELGLKEEDLDQGVVKTNKTQGGRRLKGIQTNAQLLVGDMRNFVLRITDIAAGQKKEIEVPGLTTVSINNRTFKVGTGDGAIRRIKVDISERVYIPREVALIRYFMSTGMDKWQAIEKIASLSEDEIMRLGANEANDYAKKIKEEAYSNLAKKAVMANMGFGDLHEYNVGAKLGQDPYKPADWLVLDKGAPAVNYEKLYENIAEQGGIVPRELDPAQKIAWQEFARKRKEDIAAAQLERLNAHREQVINQEQLRIVKEQLEKLKQEFQKKGETTWWKPGDEAPVETTAKEKVTQDSIKAPQSIEQDLNNLSVDTEEFINRFKNEMSETDLARLAEFDKLAADAEKAKAGFAQAAQCVIRNLL